MYVLFFRYASIQQRIHTASLRFRNIFHQFCFVLYFYNLNVCHFHVNVHISLHSRFVFKQGQINIQWTDQRPVDRSTSSGQINVQRTDQRPVDRSTSRGQINVQWTDQRPVDRSTSRGQINVQWTDQCPVDVDLSTGR